MKKLASRSAQYPLVAEFAFDFNDWVVDSVDLTKKTLGSTVALSKDPAEVGLTGPVANTIVFDCIPLRYRGRDDLPVGLHVLDGCCQYSHRSVADLCSAVGLRRQQRAGDNRLHRGQRHSRQGPRPVDVHHRQPRV